MRQCFLIRHIVIAATLLSTTTIIAQQQDSVRQECSTSDSIIQLDTFVFEGSKDAVEKTISGVILNIENTALSDFGTALDLLNYAPTNFINTSQFSNDGGLEILINGKKTNIPAENQSNFLKNIKSQNIRKIEITDKVDASIDGNKKGSINIILKPKQGLMGDVSANVGYHKDWGHFYDASLYYNHEKFRLFSNLNLEFKHYNSFSHSEEMRKDVNFNTLSNREIKAAATDFMFGGDYFINKNSSVGFLYTLGNENQYFTNLKNTYSISAVEMLEDSIVYLDQNHHHNDFMHTFTLNYDVTTDTLGSNFETSIDWAGNFYDGNVLKNYQFFENKTQFENLMSASNSDFLQNQIENNNIFAFNAKFNKKFKNKSTFTAGAKFSYTKYNSKDDFFDIFDNENIFNADNSYNIDFNEYVAAVFAGYKISYKKHFFNIGLRGELNYNIYKNNDDNYAQRFNRAILPTFLHNITFNDNHSFYYYFTQRIFRPDFFSYIASSSYDPISQTYGNSNLKPKNYYIFNTGYTFKQKYSVNLILNHANNLILSIPELDNGKLIYRLTNTGMLNYAGLEFNIPISIGEYWEMQNSLSGGYFQNIYKTDANKLYFNGFSGHFSHSSYFYLPKGFSIYLNYSYSSPSTATFYKYKDVHNLGFGIRYRINDYFLLSLSCSDILNSVKSEYSYNFSDFLKSDYFYQSKTSRAIWFKFVYSFWAGKEVDYFEKSSGIDSEKSRMMK
ncbi:TonB-dependent receptor [Bacteroidia bacterium]|nr:TonB-dependent receptor [Bacteroidia bacterium]